ncbi:MAG: hypothetical protein IVW54_19875 [Candidatus Binataceae bacterium]|nr:hypothetical protein [Candidatus Binataceae bacterium]
MAAAERRRHRIVNLVFIVYGLLLFEGVLRKWVLPQFQKELFFIRDPFVLAIYFLCLKYRIWPRKQLWTIVALAWMWLGGVLLLIEVMSGILINRIGLLLGIYGWREYFFYIPLAFVIGECLSRDDLMRVIKYTLLASIPIAILSIMQASAPATSAINAGFADNPANTYAPLDVALGFMRTSGTFSSNEGQALFIGSLIPMVLWIWILPPERRPLRRLMLWSVTLAVLTNLAVSGQRTAFVLALLVVLTALGAAALMPRGYVAQRTLKITFGLLLGGAIAALVLFQSQLNALSVRAAGAAVGDTWYSYGLVNRAAGDFTHFIELIPDAPWLGYGLGIGGNGTTRMGVSEPVSAEDDWSRNIVDLGPALGGLFIGFRILLVASLIAGAVAAARRWGDLLPLLLLGFIGIVLLYGQITGQGSVNGYAWLFAGFCIAASSTAGDEALL